MTQGRRSTGVVGLLIAAGVLLRVIFVLRHPVPAGDTLVYGDLAQNMLLHHSYGFTTDHGVKLTLIRLPGYPLFLAACFSLFGVGNYTAVLWVQVVLGVVDFCLLARLAERLWGRRAGLAVLAAGALCPFTANYCAVALTECATLLCVSVALFSLERWMARQALGQAFNRWLVPLTAALIWAVLLRPDQALLAVVVVPAVLWVGLYRGEGTFGGRALPAVAVSAALAVSLLLWGLRNERAMHVFQPLAPRFAVDPGEPNPYGFQRWYRTWAIDFKATADVYWTYDGSPVAFRDLPSSAFDDAAQQQRTADLIARYNEADASSSALDAEFMRLANERVASHPLRFYVEIPSLKVLNMWLRPRTEFMELPLDWWNFRAHARKSAECLAYGLLNAAYLGLAIAGVWRWRRVGWMRQPVIAAVMVASIVLRSALLWTIDNSEPRYTLECYPIVILLAGFALAWHRSSE